MSHLGRTQNEGKVNTQLKLPTIWECVRIENAIKFICKF